MKQIIPIDFKMPRRYRLAFYFEESQTGFKNWIIAERGRLVALRMGDGTPSAISHCLDWTADSIMQIRGELGV